MISSGTLPSALAITCHPWTTVLRYGSLRAQPLWSDSDLTRSGYLAATHMPVAAPRQTRHMGATDTDRLHERGDVVGELLRRIDAIGLVRFSRATQVDGD